MRLATKTLAAIEAMVAADQGATYRKFLGSVLPHIGDAYSTKSDRHRGHLGASMIGRECARDIWYNFNWATASAFDGRMIRLFNRGHLEEGRFIAMLLGIGCQVYQQDAQGKQFRIGDVEGYFGGSGDGVVVGIPDLPAGEAAMCEFKTYNDKTFSKLKSEGVKQSKPEHYAQMNIYMRKMNLANCLYMAVNKNNDELWAEIVSLDVENADQHLEKARSIVWLATPPPRISESAGFFKCKFCSHYKVCHKSQAPDVNCRTCSHVEKVGAGEWRCNKTMCKLTTQDQLDACGEYRVSIVFG